MSKYLTFLKIFFMDYLVYSPPCIITTFINNIHVYFQCCDSCICIIVAFVFTWNRILLFGKDNFILNLFSRKIIWMDPYLFILILSICTWLFSYILIINSIMTSSTKKCDNNGHLLGSETQTYILDNNYW